MSLLTSHEMAPVLYTFHLNLVLLLKLTNKNLVQVQCKKQSFHSYTHCGKDNQANIYFMYLTFLWG